MNQVPERVAANRRLVRRLQHMEACEQSVAWVRDGGFADEAEAWLACHRLDWLVWYVYRRALGPTRFYEGTWRKRMAARVVPALVSVWEACGRPGLPPEGYEEDKLRASLAALAAPGDLERWVASTMLRELPVYQNLVELRLGHFPHHFDYTFGLRAEDGRAAREFRERMPMPTRLLLPAELRELRESAPTPAPELEPAEPRMAAIDWGDE